MIDKFIWLIIIIFILVVVFFLGWCAGQIYAFHRLLDSPEEMLPDDPDDPDEPNIFKKLED